MSWKQNLVNAQVEVNRAVFEHNRDGMLPPLKAEPDKEYIKEHIKEAIKDLNKALAEMDNELDFIYDDD